MALSVNPSGSVRIRLARAFSILLAVLALVQCSRKPEPEPIGAIPVMVSAEGMTRGGKPYFVQGAGGGGSLAELAARGGNSIRTWTTNNLGQILDEAESHGLTVAAGIWLEHECGWFSYANPEHCEKQVRRVRGEVLRYRDHPALLAWGLGNEVEGDGTNEAFWKQIERLALLVRELDPHHPTFTAVAGLNPEKSAGMNAHAPNLDFVGINTYGGVFNLRKHLEHCDWKRPWMLTEWGPRGFWETNQSPSGAPLEQTSTEKANMMADAFRKAIHPGDGCLGSYAFVWGWKFEATATWFGLYTHEGETTNSVDVLEQVWTGRTPANRAPDIEPLRGVPKKAVTPLSTFIAIANAVDPDNDTVSWHWAVLPELQGAKHNSNEKMPKPVVGAITGPTGSNVNVTAPAKPGVYRIYVWAKDGKGHAATANMPFEVR